MSQQDWGTGNAGNTPVNNGHSRTAYVTAAPSPLQRTASTSSPPNSGPGYHFGSSTRNAPREQSPTLPPFQRPPGLNESTVERRVSRPSGVHAILNATQPEATEPRGVRRSAAEMEASGSEGRPHQLPPLGMSRPPSSAESSYGESVGSPRSTSTHTAPRRILTPRSPTLQRITSLGRLTGSIDAHQSPFLSPGSRNYTLEPGTGAIPPLPTPPGGGRTGYGFPSRNRVISPPMQPQQINMSGGAPGGASPSTTRPSYQRQPDSSSPSYPQAVGSASGHRLSYGPPPGDVGGPSNQSRVTMEGSLSAFSIPITSSSQSSSQFQLMTLNTGRGHVQIPVDMSAASKMADEKRKRNAGASARFRERRKLKEKESSNTIARLEQQLREAVEDATFYRRERDALGELLYQTPGGNRHFPRPPSPRTARPPGTPGEMSGERIETTSATGSGSYSGFSDVQDTASRMPQDPSSGGRNQRQRTAAPAIGGYNLPPPRTVTSIPPPQSYSSAFAPIVPAPEHSGSQPPQFVGPPAPGRYPNATGAPNSPCPPTAPGAPSSMTPRRTVEPPRHFESQEGSWTPGGALPGRGGPPPGSR